MSDTPQLIPLDKLTPHPGNPRLIERTDVIDQIAALIREHGFDAAHAIMARPLNGAFQILSGHNRVKAARKSELKKVPTWVREMSDDEAYMLLVLANAQSELTSLERGMHALKSGKTVRGYAGEAGRSASAVEDEINAARVAEACTAGRTKLGEYFASLVEIHRAEPWLWSALVSTVIRDDLSRDETRAMVRGFKGAPEAKWAFDWDGIGKRVVRGLLSLDDVREMLAMFGRYVELLRELDDAHPDTLLEGTVDVVLDGKNISTPVQLERVLRPLIRQIEDERAAERAQALASQERAVSLFATVSLKEWTELDENTRAILTDPRKVPATGTFNEQKGDGIDWAKWSWNPITGCLHDCPYCYARDIATLGNTAHAFPHGFAPAFKPVQLNTPRNMSVPKGANTDHRLRNVFCGSMSDWFGRWVPTEWINAVLGSIRNAPNWNFLVLTKFPKRMAEFDIPHNTWMGTTVDLQARVNNAEAAFANVNASVRWLSIEPMLEPLRFKRLDLFQWMVIGGASASSRTPEWRPPFNWITDLVAQAREAGVAVYFKPNLYGHRVLEMPNKLPVPQDYPETPPQVFDYLSDKRKLNAKPLPEHHSIEVSA
jgi:protein gp37/ParB-like chromosome segregation protein Spo0J